MNLPPSLTLSPGGAHFAQVLLRQKLGQAGSSSLPFLEPSLPPGTGFRCGMWHGSSPVGCPSCHHCLPAHHRCTWAGPL